jgi:peptidoglycan/xylan/chitin deacetylase (PgdA/CDA1 family)
LLAVQNELSAALTIDDAPSIAASGPVAFDPSRLDAARDALVAAGFERCVAFVIGRHAHGCEASLERWLQAGYELGNHSDDHVAASRCDRLAFMASIERCDALLRAVGAFDGQRPRYLRFPYGDRGANASLRRDLLAACADRGYTVADVSISFYDHCYETPLATALVQSPALTHAVEERYLANAARVVRRAARLGPRRFGRGHVHVANCHFGLVTQRTLVRLLARITPPVQWLPLEKAVGSVAYARFLDDFDRNGIIADQLRSGSLERVLRPLARVGRRADWFAQRALGPRWPHLAD